MSPHAPSARIWSEIVLLGLIWGITFIAVKLALGELPVMTLVAHRVFWAALIVWAWVLWRGFALPRGARAWIALAVMGFLNNALPFTLMAWGQQFIEAGLTTIFNAATAVFAVLVAAIVFADERLTTRRLIGVVTAFAGVVTAIGIDTVAQFDIRSAAQFATLAGAFSYALAAAWGRALLSQFAPEVSAAGMLSMASLILIPIAVLVDGPPRLPSYPITYVSVGFLASIGTAIAYLLYYRILRGAGSGNAMLVTLIIPPVTIVLGAIFLNERLTTSAFVGFLLIALGLVILDGRAFAKLRRT